MTDLAPCPFCGGVDLMALPDEFGDYSVWCQRCEAQGPTAGLKESACDLWNTRADAGRAT